MRHLGGRRSILALPGISLPALHRRNPSADAALLPTGGMASTPPLHMRRNKCSFTRSKSPDTGPMSTQCLPEPEMRQATRAIKQRLCCTIKRRHAHYLSTSVSSTRIVHLADELSQVVHSAEEQTAKVRSPQKAVDLAMFAR